MYQLMPAVDYWDVKEVRALPVRWMNIPSANRDAILRAVLEHELECKDKKKTHIFHGKTIIHGQLD